MLRHKISKRELIIQNKNKESPKPDFLADKHALGVRHSPAEIHHLRSLAWACRVSLSPTKERNKYVTNPETFLSEDKTET